MPRIDAHGHVFPSVSREFPRETGGNTPPDREETVEKLMTYMAASDIDQAMLVQMGGATPAHHAYVLHCLRTYPERFLGIGLIPEEVFPSPQEHMDRLTDGTSIVGFRLGLVGGPEGTPSKTWTSVPSEPTRSGNTRRRKTSYSGCMSARRTPT